MWTDVVGEVAQTEWVFDMDGYTWVGDMLVYEEDLWEIDEMESVEYVM